MKNPSCLIMLITYPLFAIALCVLFFLNHPEAANRDALTVLGESSGTAAASAFFLMLAALWVHCARRKLREVGIFHRARDGRLPDGEKLVFQGVIQAEGPLLHSPLTGRDCVAYRYKITRPSKEDRPSRRAELKWVLDAQGFAMAPCRIQGQMSSVALLGYPEFWFTADEPRGPESYERARAYARSTGFEESRTVIKEHLFEVQEQRLRADETLRVDQCTEDWSRTLPFDPASPRATTNCFLEEQVVAPGDPVAAVGPYSAAAGGIVPAKNGLGRPDLRVRLYKGDAAALVRTLHRDATIYACLVLVALGATAAIVYGFLGGGLQRSLGW